MQPLRFASLDRRQIVAEFDGGDLTSDGGLPLLREVDRRIGLVTDDPVHGQQEGRFFHGYYDEYCFLPLYVFCGDQFLVAYLRTADGDGARHTRLRQLDFGTSLIASSCEF